jgi:hypothetical protein
VSPHRPRVVVVVAVVVRLHASASSSSSSVVIQARGRNCRRKRPISPEFRNFDVDVQLNLIE